MFRMFLTVAMLVALITPGAQAAAKIEDAFAEPVPEPVPDQSTPTLGTIPAQAVAICCELELDLSNFVTGTIGTLLFGASTPDTNVATVSMSGSELTITAVAEGQAQITVTLGDTMTTTFTVTVQAGSPWSVSDAGNVYRLEGNVGIGVDDPDERLVVDGRIKAEEIRLEDVTPADYVFDEDYDLMSLDALKEHIRARGHLPGIAPGAQMEAEGVSVGRMQTRLLEKVEELMLYTIDQHRTLSSQREVIDAQEQQLGRQERYIQSLEQRLSKLEQNR
ncbi:MAG: Ig-like domain-containing protein [Gemmatimonadota bacterium]|nr:Ig-like domain-containing protein [Gemmatimonadota bacterium]